MRLFCSVFLALLALPLLAQQRVSGRVTLSPTGEEAVGATIQVKGTNKGTTTDLEGQFSLEVEAPSAILVVAYTGFSTQEVAVDAKRFLEIRLEESATALNEVVVTGYGVQKRSSISGSVSTIKSEELADKPILRVEQALQGRIAGVQVAQVSGSPGAGLTVRVRGTGTINDSDPLYIVDGIPVNGLDFLNPNDIETINVLKDAASAAIYGSRGANGVVLITTKGGKKESTGSVTYDAYYGIQRPWRLLDLLTATEYATLQNEAYLAAGKTPLPEFANPAALGRGTDWQEAIFQKAPIASHQITMKGGSSTSSYALTGNYFAQDGIVGGDKSSFERATIRLNGTNEIKKWLTVGSNIGFTWLERRALIENNQFTSPLLRALNMDPTTPVYKQDGTFAYSKYADTDIANPVNSIAQTHNRWRTNRLVGGLFAEMKLGSHLRFRTTGSTDITFATERNFIPRFDLSSVAFLSEAPAAEKNLVNSVGVGNFNWRNWQIENVLTYENTFREDHQLSLIAGTTALNNRTDASGGANTNLPSNDPKDAYISNTIDPIGSQSAWQWASESSLFSVFGKANYQFRETYLFSATLRADGSSRFGRNNRYGYFPSFSAGWIVSHENFWQVPMVNYFKLRASWGQNGNDRIGDYSFTTVVNNGQNYSFGSDEVITNGSVALSAANPDLKWETSTQTNVGVDMELLQGRFQFTGDYYIKKTSDMLYAAPIPLVAGTAPPIQNIATAENRGLELALEYRNYDHPLKFSVGGNVAFVKSEVTGLGRGGEPVQSGLIFSANAFAARTDVGHPIAAFYGFVTDGIFQNQAEVESHAFQSEGTAPGDIRFKDLDGNGVINADDRTFIGNPTPDVVYGFNSTLQWEGFELSLFVQGTQGNDIYNGTTRYDFAYVNRPSSALTRWTGPGTSNVEPRVNLSDPNQNARISDRFIEDGSYIRLKNLQLAYFLPATALKKVSISRAKVFVAGQNLLTYTRYSGLDPEIGAVGGSLELGIDRGFYPQARTVTAGVSITF